MRPSRADVLFAVLAEPGGITTRRLAEKLLTVPYQVHPNLSKLAAHGQIAKMVISPRGDAVWGPIINETYFVDRCKVRARVGRGELACPGIAELSRRPRQAGRTRKSQLAGSKT